MKPVSIANAEHYLCPLRYPAGVLRECGDCDGWRLLQRDDLSVIQERVPPGRAEVRHYHNTSRQFFYILAGVGTMQIGEEAVTLHKGDRFEIPPQVLHQLRNESYFWWSRSRRVTEIGSIVEWTQAPLFCDPARWFCQ